MLDCLVADLGLIDYSSAVALQRDLHQRVVTGELPALLLLLQHPHVYTLGRRGTETDILASPDTIHELGAEVYHTDRGGEVTYHGPGQLVGYPILDLRAAGLGPLAYVRALERVIISTLAELGIHATSEGRPTGVWVDDAKIAAIGVRVSRGVTMHGFALNVNPDLTYFNHIVPCGMPNASVTSVAEQEVALEVSGVIDIFSKRFADILGYSLIHTTLSALTEQNLPVVSTAQRRL
ncbi:MAG: lipoyl(octanoyl) transferase LipB [Dehalococcoidia bacterium]|nr:lipoyl(octanoyl) transferase LipB [Dehalococcoidia bacterium]